MAIFLCCFKSDIILDRAIKISKCVCVSVCLSLSHMRTLSLSPTPPQTHRKPLETQHTQGPSLFTSFSPQIEAALLPRQQPPCEIWKSGGETAQSNCLGKERKLCLSTKTSTERPENFYFCLDHPGQITLLWGLLTWAQRPSLPLTFHTGVT